MMKLRLNREPAALETAAARAMLHDPTRAVLVQDLLATRLAACSTHFRIYARRKTRSWPPQPLVTPASPLQRAGAWWMKGGKRGRRPIDLIGEV
jgi:hypothetical protein